MDFKGVTEFFSPLRGNLLVLVVSLIFWIVPHRMVSPYQSLYVLALGGSGTILGFMGTIQSLLGIALRIPGGAIADRLGRKRIIGLVTTLASFAYLFYIFAQSWVWLFIGSSILAITSIYSPALQALRADSVTSDVRARGFIFFNVLPMIPAIFAPALGGMLIADATSRFGINLGGVRLSFTILFFGVLMAGLIRLIFLKETLWIDPLRDEGTKLNFSTLFKDWFRTTIHLDKRFRRLILLNGFFMFCFHFDALFRGVYAVEVKGIPADQWGIIVSISLGVMIMASLIIGGFIDRYERKKIFIPSILAVGLATAIFLLGKGFIPTLLAMIIINTGSTVRMMTFQALIADSTPKEMRGRIFSVVGIVGSLGWSASYFFSGMTFDMEPRLPFLFSIAAYIVAVSVAMTQLEESKDRYE